MTEADAGKRAERPERPRRVGGGTAEGTGDERQAGTARSGKTGEEDPKLMEEVVRSLLRFLPEDRRLQRSL